MRLHFLLSVLALLPKGGNPGSIGEGGPCSSTNNHLDPSSFKFISECSDQTFCAAAATNANATGTCKPRLCRRDEFPFGFDSDLPLGLPPLCAPGSFCPDEGSGCLLQAPAGAPCQLNRDEQCAPPYDWRDLASPYNYNGSICLRFVCMHANATLGQACVRDTTTYVDVGPPTGDVYNSTIMITRDNCRSPDYYCDEVRLICQLAKPVGSACSSDTQCSTRYCTASTCMDPPETPLRVSTWQWIVITAIVILAIILTCTILTLLHRRHRLQQEKELREYYVDQLSLRRAIIALHTAAAEACAEKSELFEEDHTHSEAS